MCAAHWWYASCTGSACQSQKALQQHATTVLLLMLNGACTSGGERWGWQQAGQGVGRSGLDGAQDWWQYPILLLGPDPVAQVCMDTSE